MKEKTRNGPLMDQHRRQKGLRLPQINTAFGTVEDVLEERTESNISNNEDTRNGAMAEDEISGTVQNAMYKARKATQSLSPRNRGSSPQKGYTSFFPSLENIVSTSSTLQHAQSLLARNTPVSPNSTSEREQPDVSANLATSTKNQHARPYASAPTTPTMRLNPSDFVMRKVEDEIANAKKVAQQAFNRVASGGGGGSDDVIDLTDAPTQNDDDRFAAPSASRSHHHYDEREMVQESYSQGHQLGANSTWRSEGPNSTWRSEGPACSTWRSEAESERPLDSMMSDDYGLVYDYSMNASMSSIGQPNTGFCTFDNPLIRVMEHHTGMNIIDLTNVVDEFEPAQCVDTQFRAASPEQASLASMGTEDSGMLDTTIENTNNDSKKSETKRTSGVRAYPILPVKTPNASSPRSGAKKAELKTIPTAAVNQGDSRTARLRKIRQPVPMHIVKEDSHEDSQGNPDENERMDQAKGEDGDIAVDEKPESPQQQQVITEIESVHPAGKEDEHEANEGRVTDQQVEEALITSVETPQDEGVEGEAPINSAETAADEGVEDFQSAKEEPDTAPAEDARQVVKGQSSLESGFEALIDSVETTDALDNAARYARNETEQPGNVQVQEEGGTVDSSSKLANGFDKLLSFFRDQDEINFVMARHNVLQKSMKHFIAEPSKMKVKPSTEDVVMEIIEVEEDGTISEQTAASEEQPANETRQAEQAEEKEKTLSPRVATSLIKALGNFGATDSEDSHVVEGNEASTNGIEREIQNDNEVRHEQEEGDESKNPLVALFDAAREARAPVVTALGMGFMEAKENHTESAVSVPGEVDGPEDQLGYSANLNKSGESNEKNSLIEEGVSSMEEQEMPSPLPSQNTADDEHCTEPATSEPSAPATEDFHHEAEEERPMVHEVEQENMVSDPLSSMYRAPEPEKELEAESTRVSLKGKYDEPPAEYSTRPTEDIINDNRVEAPIPKLTLLEPTDEIQKLQNSIMGESVTRRFNACGALKMFAMNKSNQLALARTDGFFDALIVALTTDLVGKDREAAYGTRTRALEILTKICMPKENRVIIFYHPDLIESIVSCAIEDSGEIRLAACSVLAMVAKSGHLREPLAQVDGLLDVLGDSLLGLDSQKATPVEGKFEEVRENDENYATDDFSSSSDSLSDNCSSSGSETSFEDSRAGSTDGNRSHAAKLKQKELEEKKKETTKQVTISACATLLHLSKQCAAGHFLCHNTSLLDALLILSQQFEHQMHSRCLEILCNLTRLPSNNEILAEHPSVVPVMLRLSTSEKDEDRVWALRMLENISASKAGKQVLVSTFALEMLSMSVLRTQAEEQKAAIAALFNLSTDPGCLIAITNTRDVLSSLVLVAQDMNTMSEVRLMACDMLATIGLWFQKLAGTSTVPDGVKEQAIPSNVTTGWNRWE